MFKLLSDVVLAATVPADWIGIRAVRDASRTCAMRDGHPDANRWHLDEGAMVEVLVKGQFGYSATNHLSPAALAAAVDQAYGQALAASAWAVHRFTPAARPKATGSSVCAYQQGLDTLPPERLNELMIKVCHGLQVSEQIVQTSASAKSHDIETWFVSSNGSEVYQRYCQMWCTGGI